MSNGMGFSPYLPTAIARMPVRKTLDDTASSMLGSVVAGVDVDVDVDVDGDTSIVVVLVVDRTEECCSSSSAKGLFGMRWRIVPPPCSPGTTGQLGCGAALVPRARRERWSRKGVLHGAAGCDERRKEEFDGDRGTGDERAGTGQAAEVGVKVKVKAGALDGGRGITVGTTMLVASRRRRVNGQKVGMVKRGDDDEGGGGVNYDGRLFVFCLFEVEKQWMSHGACPCKMPTQSTRKDRSNYSISCTYRIVDNHSSVTDETSDASRKLH